MNSLCRNTQSHKLRLCLTAASRIWEDYPVAIERSALGEGDNLADEIAPSKTEKICQHELFVVLDAGEEMSVKFEKDQLLNPESAPLSDQAIELLSGLAYKEV